MLMDDLLSMWELHINFGLTLFHWINVNLMVLILFTPEYFFWTEKSLNSFNHQISIEVMRETRFSTM